MSGIRLRHIVSVGPRLSVRPKPETPVTFAPMEAIADGIGGLDISRERPFEEVASGSYNYFGDGDILLAKVTPCFENGKKALASDLKNGIGFATSEVHVLRPKPGCVYPRFLVYLLSSEHFKAAGISSMTGSGGLRRVSDEAILNYRPQVTDFDNQKAIADFLDRETARIDALVEKKKSFLEHFTERLESLVGVALRDKSLQWMRFENISKQVFRPAKIEEHNELVRLGLYNRGRGIFMKPAADAENIGVSDFFFVEDGDLVISGQFAWEGAVAMVSRAQEGCVVSHRYPVYRGHGVRTSYLLSIFRSSYGDMLLNDASRGSAGRNRPLNTRRLAKEKIPVASEALQSEIEKCVAMETHLRDMNAKSIAFLIELRASLITAAVTGQIDPATYRRNGTMDRALDRIAEEMAQ